MINIAKRILILSEDKKSSKIYFESFKKDEKLKRDLSSVDIQVIHPKNHDPVGLVTKAKEMKRKAKRERNPYDEIWIVLDRDGHANIDQALNTAQANKIEVALSVVCFEYWILYIMNKPRGHLENVMISFTTLKKIIFRTIKSASTVMTT